LLGFEHVGALLEQGAGHAGDDAGHVGTGKGQHKGAVIRRVSPDLVFFAVWALRICRNIVCVAYKIKQANFIREMI
jgi:hypothetical protein